MTKNKKNNSSKTILEGLQLRISIQRLQTFVNHFPPARSFSDFKKNNERRSEIFQEISNRKRTESQKRKRKRELNKSQKDLSDEQ